MGFFAAMLCPYFKSSKGCDYGNKPIDLSFQSRNVVEFLSPFSARSVCSKKFFLHCILNLYLVSEISFSNDVFYLFSRKRFYLVSIISKSRSP